VRPPDLRLLTQEHKETAHLRQHLLGALLLGQRGVPPRPALQRCLLRLPVS
jgi:hypothetical protein